MKKILSLILAVGLTLGCLCSCNSGNKQIIPKHEDIHTSYAGIYITITDVTDNDGVKILNVVWHNETVKTVTFDNRYDIEYNDGGEWKSVLRSNFSVTEIAYTLEPDSVRDKNYSTEYFNLSKNGEFRLCVDFYVTENENKVMHGSSQAIFTVADKQ